MNLSEISSLPADNVATAEQPSLQNTEASVASLLHAQPLGIDLHCHFEGVLSLQNLQEVATALDENMLLQPDTWDFIAQTMSDPTISLQNFSKRLTARWMRLICLAALAKHGTPVTTTMRLLFTKALEVMHAQGLCALELMISVYSLSASGDFDTIPLSTIHTAEEEQLIGTWNTSLRQSHAIPLEGLLRLFKEVIDEDERFCSPESAHQDTRQMQVGLKFMIRREKDHQFANDSRELSAQTAAIEQLYNQNLIVGVDIAGDEYEASGSVDHYASFLTKLRQKNIPFTIHAGEVANTSSEVQRSYQNLRTAVDLGARRIGHAVRLFDQTEAMQELMLEVLEKDMYLEINITSNAWTGATNTLESADHPVIRALNGNHPLFTDPSRLQKLRDRVIIGDDDPVVVSPTGNSFVQEMALVAHHTNNMGEDSVLAMLEQRRKVALRALLSNTRLDTPTTTSR